MLNHIFKKSPWDNGDDGDNIFTRSRRSHFNFPGDFKFNFNKKGTLLIIIALLALWFASGIYAVKEGEEAAVIRFGRFVSKGYPGLNYHLPAPIETVIIEKVNQSRRIEIGYRSGTGRGATDTIRPMGAESTMLTGDENIVELNCDVMWHISDLEKFIFNVLVPEETVKTAAESAIREIIAGIPISSVLSNQKQEISDKVEELTQRILDQYGAGVVVEKVQLLKAEPPQEVIDAYRDVQTSKADKEREINQAQAYNNDVLPKARGEAAKALQEAEGYKQEVIARAEGDTKRFLAVYAEYVNNRQVTRDRLRLEATEEVLKNSGKTIIGTEGTLPHMAIGQKQIKN